MAAAPPPPRAAPPSQKKERAATHGIRFWMKKLPGWKGHHKFYIGLISLLAVTVWLVIALFVWGVEFPEDIVGCAAVVFEVTLKVGLFAFIFQRYVAGEGPVVAPTDPEGSVGKARNLHAWSRSVFDLDQDEVRAKAGVDGALHVRRVRMRLACLEIWALLAFPLAVVFALDPARCIYQDETRTSDSYAKADEGCPTNCGALCYTFRITPDKGQWAGEVGADDAPENTDNCGSDKSERQYIYKYDDGDEFGTIYEWDDYEFVRGVWCPCVAKRAGWRRARSPGFDRIHITNVFCRAGSTAVWQLWAAVLVLWLGHWAAYRIIDAHDLEAQEIIREAADGAPAHHYAVVCTGLPEELRDPLDIRTFFESVFQVPGSVVAVVPCRHLDAETRAVRDEEAPGGEARAAVAAQEDKIARLKATGASAHSIKAAEDHHRTLMETVVREVGALSWYLTGDGGLRGRVRKFIDELKEIERARWREELQRRWDSGEKKKIQQGCAKCIDGCICCCSFVEHSVEDEAADPADAISRAEAARLKLIEHAGEEAPRGGSAVVVFNSLELAQCATNCPLGATNDPIEVPQTYRPPKLHHKPTRFNPLFVLLEKAGYYLTGLKGCLHRRREPVPMELTPLPEPRDVDWAELETLDSEHGEKADRASAGRFIKICCWFGYSVLIMVFTVEWEDICLKRAQRPSGVRRNFAIFWELLGGLVPAYFQDWLFDYVAVILRATNRMFSSLWSESSLQMAVARDYSIFFWIVAFGAYLVGQCWEAIEDQAWVCNTVGGCSKDDEKQDGEDAEAYRQRIYNAKNDGWSFDAGTAVKLMIRELPRQAWPFSALFLLQIGDMVAEALRVEPYVMWRLLQRAWIASDAAVEETLEADDADLGTTAGWEAFALLVGACFAAVAPVTCFVCYLYFVAAYEVAKHTLCCLEEMPFDTGGHLWFFGVEQTYHALLIALVMQLAIILINESSFGAWPALGGLPILGLWKRYYDVAQLRHATRNLHGLSRGRMPLRDCAVVDARRDVSVVKDALKHLADTDKFFEAPEVLPPSDHPSYVEAIPGPPITDGTDVAARLEAIDDWLGRHGDAGDAFLQKVNVRGPGMSKAASLFGLGAGVVPVAEEDVAVVDDVACGALGCGLAD